MISEMKPVVSDEKTEKVEVEFWSDYQGGKKKEGNKREQEGQRDRRSIIILSIHTR